MIDWPEPQNASVFLDFDGTLVDIADTPAAVAIPDDLPALLAELASATQGRVVLLTGRDVDAVHGFVPEFRGPVAGCHGAEIWDGAKRSVHPVDQTALAAAVRSAHESPLTDKGMTVEPKPTGFVLHYRAAPALEPEVARVAATLCGGLDRFVTVDGKMSVEVRPEGVGKKQALANIMEQQGFTGTVPLFFGDDTTDISALRYVQDAGGLAGYVGTPPSGITLSFATPSILRRALSEWVSHGRS